MEKTLARSIIYDFLAKGFLYPDKTVFNTFTDPEFVENLKGAARQVQENKNASIYEEIDDGISGLKEMGIDGLLTEYERLFGTHSRNIRVTLNQTEIIVDEKKPAFMAQTHDMADIAGCYKAFGFEAAKIRPDHFGVELEFMHVLAFKEFLAMKEREAEKQAICAAAGKMFLLKYLGPSGCVFAEGVREATGSGYFKFLARALAWFIEREHDIVLGRGDKSLCSGK
ncbi:MAG: molecular chaperone TorD family protein [Nitrospinae bacterium]|nr:molecular chaperone TorD family protein [Nitrospinota bacterium]